MAFYGSVNSECLGWNGLVCDPERLDLFRNLVWLRFSSLLNGVEAADPIKVFIKQEPHKLEKIREGRYRLISAVSLIDTMVDRILFAFLARRMLSSVGKTPCLVGWTPLYGGHRLLAGEFPDEVICLDKSMWDWTVPAWLVEAWLNFLRNIVYEPAEWWLDMVTMRFRMLFRSATFMFLDGTVCKQPCWGIMKSGCYLTILLNSLGQSLCHYVAAARLSLPIEEIQPWCMGDDTVQHCFPRLEDYLKVLEELGVIPKRAMKQDWVEFAGFAITRDCAWPSYWKKHLYILRHMEETFAVETLVSYQLLYTYEPVMLAVIQRELVRRDPTKIRSQLELRELFQ